MPFIHTRVNCAMDQETEKRLSVGMGKAISLLPGKSESWLMLQYEDNCRLYFKGDSRKKLAIIQVGLFGEASASACEALTKELTRLVGAEMDMAADGIYVQYTQSEHWGWNGSNF